MSTAAVRKGKKHEPADSKHVFCYRGRDTSCLQPCVKPNRSHTKTGLCRCGGGQGRRQEHLSRQGAALPEGDVIAHAAQQLRLCRILILQLLLQRHHLANCVVLLFQVPHLPCCKRDRLFDTIPKLYTCALISALMFINKI